MQAINNKSSVPPEKKPIVILSGPQGIGKTQNSERLASLLGCDKFLQEWNGRDELQPGTLVETNHIDKAPPGATVYCVQSRAEIEALIEKLQSSGS